MMPSSENAEVRMVRTVSISEGDSSLWDSTSIMPITPFMGVRISWLIAARNTLLARLAASAASRACCSSSVRSATRRSRSALATRTCASASFCDVMSTLKMQMPSAVGSTAIWKLPRRPPGETASTTPRCGARSAMQRWIRPNIAVVSMPGWARASVRPMSDLAARPACRAASALT